MVSPGAAPPLAVAVVRLPDSAPVDRPEAAIAAAFDPEAAAALLTNAPADLDWSQLGVVCVYLGEREGGWDLAIQGGAMVGGELHIRARETRPAPGVSLPGPVYPADCATVSRAGLPTGPLQVRADDTVSDEFIVSGEIEVPAP